ncbi:hypothetical protein [Shimia haliotis]|uniref:Uncharacterized protein n=1 Tax=Shimia haliotis TaxID=1280847 RepID=A0A1I4AVK0_9RHOB|nr:hypothetical protein [Shimia haliotis]SFK59967.1 hypothetical protein SAMN04488036_101603 [Shimia haliotis]
MAHNPTLSVWEYIETTAYKGANKTSAVVLSGQIAIIAPISETCDEVEFNRYSKDLMSDKLNRARYFQGGKDAIAEQVAIAEKQYESTYGVSFAPGAPDNKCWVAHKEIEKQSPITAFMWDKRLARK